MNNSKIITLDVPLEHTMHAKNVQKIALKLRRNEKKVLNIMSV